MKPLLFLIAASLQASTIDTTTVFSSLGIDFQYNQDGIAYSTPGGIFVDVINFGFEPPIFAEFVSETTPPAVIPPPVPPPPVKPPVPPPAVVSEPVEAWIVLGAALAMIYWRRK